MIEVLTWDDHSWLRPYIRAAERTGRPPTALLLNGPVRRTEWSKWDDLLVSANALLEGYEQTGFPVWIEESPRIVFTVRRETVKSTAAVEKAQWNDQHSGQKRSKGQKAEKPPVFGRRYVPVPKTVDGGPWPRKADWVAAQDPNNVNTQVADPALLEKYRNKRRGGSTVE